MITSNYGKLHIQLLIAVACTSAAQADSMSFLSSDTLPLNLTQVVALPANAQATPPSGAGKTAISDYLYLMGDVGVTMTQDVNMKNALGLTGVQFGLDTGMRFDLGIGYDLTSWFSVEATAGLIWNSISNVSGTETSSNTSFNLNATGNVYNIPIMVNGKFRIPITKEANSPQIVLGGGIGALWSQYDLDSVAGFSSSANGTSSSTWAFAYQATAGVEWKLGNNLHLGIAYAFLGTTQLNYEYVTADALYTHSILATLRYEF
jgi:opacity protein-like surface antigen